MTIKKFKDFINEEAISGTELVDRSFGSGSPASSVPNTINYNDTSVILADDNHFYTKDEFIKLIQDFHSKYPKEYQYYLKKGYNDEFIDSNINMILHLIKNATIK